MSNDPKVLIEFDPEEITWLADQLHMLRNWADKAILMADGKDKEKLVEKLEEYKKMEARLRNRILDKADNQGFGNL